MKTDLDIQQEIINNLRSNSDLKAAAIGVAVKNGVATLSGVASSVKEKFIAQELAKCVDGVIAIAEEIDVNIGPTYMKTDVEIAEAVIAALKRENLTSDKIKVIVEHGFVTVEGEVDSQNHKELATSVIKTLISPLKVFNSLKVREKNNRTQMRKASQLVY
jgi:osmotically-inducible protein OsmY